MMKTLDIVLVIISIALVGWVVFLRDEMLDESFAGSDWNTAFWGQQVWNGWGYASAPLSTPPRPEDTSYLS